MMSCALRHPHSRRLMNEISKLSQMNLDNDGIELLSDPSTSLTEVSVRIKVVDGDSYLAGATFIIGISIPQDWPFQPPKVKFLGAGPWHPNISSQTGSICLDILKDKWNPLLSLEKVLLSLIILIHEPVADDPLDTVIGPMWLKDDVKCRKIATFWSVLFHGCVREPCAELAAELNTFMDLTSCTKSEGMRMLANAGFDVESATTSYFEG